MFNHIKNGNVVRSIPISEIDSITFSTGVMINGILWATCNVDMPGTFAATPSELGMFYQWNRRVGWSSTDPMINSNGGTTWDGSIPPIYNPSLEANDPCPPGWRVPYGHEQQLLINSGSFWGELNGVPGRFFGSGEQKVFFPAAGYRYCIDGRLHNVGNYGSYWGNQGAGDIAALLYFFDLHTDIDYNLRSFGNSVRCVAE